MSAATAIAEEDLEQTAGATAQQAAPEAAQAAAGGEGAAAKFASEGALPEVGKPETKVADEPTASEQAYGKGEEVTPADRAFMIHAAQSRMAAAVGPFTLACSNRRDEIHKAVTQHPEFLHTLATLAFGNLVPGINGKNSETGAGMTPSTSKLVSSAVGHSAQMKRVLETVGKIPMINFGLNFGEMSASESSEEFIDQLGTHVGDANELMRNGLEGSTNEELASLCAAFDPKTMTCSIYEEHIDRELSKLSTEAVEEKPPEDEMEAKPTKELAYVGDPGEGDKNQLAVVEKDPKASGEDKHKVKDMVPDEMKEMAISKHGEEPGTLYQDEMYRR